MKKISVLFVLGLVTSVVFAQPVTDIREVGTVISDNPIGTYTVTLSQDTTELVSNFTTNQRDFEIEDSECEFLSDSSLEAIFQVLETDLVRCSAETQNKGVSFSARQEMVPGPKLE